MSGVESRRVGGGPASEGGPAPKREPRVEIIKAKNYYYSTLSREEMETADKLYEFLDVAGWKTDVLANIIITVAQHLCGIDDMIHDITIRAEDDRGRYRLKITW